MALLLAFLAGGVAGAYTSGGEQQILSGSVEEGGSSTEKSHPRDPSTRTEEPTSARTEETKRANTSCKKLGNTRISRPLKIPVLEYHSFGPVASRYVVKMAAFKKQLEWLKDNGHTTVTLGQAYDYMFRGEALPDKPVIITFDDGRDSQWWAAKELNERGMKGVFFVMGGGTELTDDQLRQIGGWGHEIESHTMTHPINPELPGVSDKRLAYEVNASKRKLEQKFGVPMCFLAYPGGSFNDRVIEATEEAGYRGALYAWGGGDWKPENRWAEPRIELRGTYTFSRFTTRVENATQSSYPATR